MRCASARRSGRGWCTGWIVIRPACCCWRARRGPRRSWQPRSAARAVEKTYWAVVARRPIPPEGRIDLPLRRIGGARGERTEIADRDDKDAARAITDYRTLDHAGQKLAWLELQPADRAHAPASGALRRDRRADPGRREIRAAGSEQRVQRHGGGALKRTSLACAGASAAPSRGRNIAGGGGPAAPHDRDVPHPGLSRAGGAPAERR